MPIKDPVTEGIKGLMNMLKAFFSVQSTYIWSGLLGTWGELVEIIKTDIKAFFADLEDSQWEALVNSYIASGLLKEEQKEHILKLKDTASPFDWFLFISVAVAMFTNLVSRVTSPNAQLLEIKNNELYRPRLPSEFSILNAAFVAPEKTTEVRKILAKQGIPDDMINLMFIALYKLYDENMVKTLYLRKVINKDEMFMRMRELGYTDTRTKEIIQSWEVIPSPQDLLWMVAKEAFEDKTAEELGLDDEFPKDQLEWLEKQGISEKWARKYWRAHWTPPMLGHGFEMLHRKVIKPPDLDLLFKTQEIPLKWRDRLTQIAYKPYTRVDVRRMHKLGVIEPENLKEAYTDLGYDDKKAEEMVKFTIAYNSKSQTQLTKAQILTGYRKKFVIYEDAKALLIDIGYIESIAEYSLALEDYKDTEDLQDEVLKNIKVRYTENIIDKQQAMIDLNKLNLPAEQTAILLDRWDLIRFQDRKLPSRRDLENFLINNVIDLDKFRLEMYRLGYNFNYTNWYEQIAIKRKERLALERPV